MRLDKIFLLVLAGAIFCSCSKKTTTVSPADQVQGLSSKGLIYALPATMLNIEVTAERHAYFPGPYAKFAEKYLGIDNVTTQEQVKWSIVSVCIQESQIPDLNSLFVVESEGKTHFLNIELTEKGLIIPMHSVAFSHVSKESNFSDYDTQTNFSDLSHTPFIASERTTHYSRVFQDSTFVRVPVHKDVIVEKSLEEKAKEAANFIFSLRKRRFELISGDADFICEGSAVQEVFDEISRLEKEYLSLFVGKHFTKRKKHEFSYLPAKPENGGSILFRFSESKGVLAAADLTGSPVLIEVSLANSWNNMGGLDNLSLEIDEQKRDAFYYRIPVPVYVKISGSSGELFNSTLTVNHYGPLVRVPADYSFGK